MKIVIAGGTGYLGQLLSTYFLKDQKNKVFILSRTEKLNEGNLHYLKWDGKTIGYWKQFLENTDVLINLTGRSVDCRYTQKNKDEIYASRIESTHVLCQVVQQLKSPPKVFIQSSSATIYRHSEDKLMTEKRGEIGIDFSMDVCKKWEMVFNSYALPKTKKIITRTSIVMGNNGGALPILKTLALIGFGGKQGKGNQFISWISEEDYVRSIVHLIHQKGGVYNLCVPNTLQNATFQRKLRIKLGVFFGLNMPKWLLKIGAKIIGTEPELILKSRRVYPENLLKTGFTFKTNNFDAFAI
jgi:uncharacterized protein (TIGR01777 family)